MIKLENNVRQVIDQLQLIKAGVERGRARLLAHTYWRERATVVATDTVTLLAKPDETQHILTVVRTIVSGVFEDGFMNSMSAKPKSGRAVDIKGLAMSVPLMDDPARGESLPLWRAAFFAHQDEAFEAIRQWVESGQKEIDERDKNLDPLEIAENIYEILFNEERTPGRDAARDSLLKTDEESDNPTNPQHPHLLDAVRKSAGVKGLDPESAERWLLAVLAAWRKLITHEWRARYWEGYHSK